MNAHDKLTRTLLSLLSVPGNTTCADCGAKFPRWASANIGIFICMRCAGIHRSLGVQISKVKSIELDKWTSEQVQLMQSMGNEKVKQEYEVDVPSDRNWRLHISIGRSEDYALEQWIRDKYERKLYTRKASAARVAAAKPQERPVPEPTKVPNITAPNASSRGRAPRSPTVESNFFAEAADANRGIDDSNSLINMNAMFSPQSGLGAPTGGPNLLETEVSTKSSIMQLFDTAIQPSATYPGQNSAPGAPQQNFPAPNYNINVAHPAYPPYTRPPGPGYPPMYPPYQAPPYSSAPYQPNQPLHQQNPYQTGPVPFQPNQPFQPPFQQNQYQPNQPPYRPGPNTMPSPYTSMPNSFAPKFPAQPTANFAQDFNPRA